MKVGTRTLCAACGLISLEKALAPIMYVCKLEIDSGGLCAGNVRQ